MPMSLSCRWPWHTKDLVILSAAKDLRSEALGLPGHPADHRVARSGHAAGCPSPATVRASAPHRLEDPSGSALRMTPESFGMPRALSCRWPWHTKDLVSLSAAKDLHSETSDLPSHPADHRAILGRPRSRVHVARQILRPAVSG